MEERVESFEKEDQDQESALDVTELDGEDLDDVSGGLEGSSTGRLATNENCGVC